MDRRRQERQVRLMEALDRTIRTTDDLRQAWLAIDGGHGYAAPQLFALHLDTHDLILPNVIQMYDEGPPDSHLIGRLMNRLGEVLQMAAPGGSVAIMKARAGSATMTGLDRDWCRLLHHHLMAAPFATRPLFYATGAGVGVVPPDLLIGDAG